MNHALFTPIYPNQKLWLPDVETAKVTQYNHVTTAQSHQSYVINPYAGSAELFWSVWLVVVIVETESNNNGTGHGAPSSRPYAVQRLSTTRQSTFCHEAEARLRSERSYKDHMFLPLASSSIRKSKARATNRRNTSPRRVLQWLLHCIMRLNHPAG